jgi:hypothetical protein
MVPKGNPREPSIILLRRIGPRDTCQAARRFGWTGASTRLMNECRFMDPFIAQLRASYRIVDHRERQIAPHSLAFNLSATKYPFFLFLAPMLEFSSL